MTIDVGDDFDVVVTLEVLSHVADQPAFMRRLFEWLKPGGELMLATQNKPVLSRFNRIPAPAPGQLRRWVDREELRKLASDAGFRIDEIFVVSPKADHGIMRVIAKAGRMTHTSRFLERLGFGWTTMLRATRPS
jgi:2-polyprenyl-3-methyl-5-hydroxy-6-metoxy-1,4-benzoquinol methylase